MTIRTKLMELLEFLNARDRGIYASGKERFQKMIRLRNIAFKKANKQEILAKGCAQANSQAARRRQERSEHGRIITPLNTPVSI